MSLSLELKAKQGLNIKQMQRLMMSNNMQLALKLLQSPVMELNTIIDAELEQNPCLEVAEDDEIEEVKEEDPQEQELNFDERDLEILRRLDEDFGDYLDDSPNFKTKQDDAYQTYLESSIQEETTLFEHLMKQAHEVFSSEEERQLAMSIIGNIDEQGYLTTPLAEIAQLCGSDLKKLQDVLKEIQTFEPFGVGAVNLQEMMLIQLCCLHQKKSLAYAIIENHYEDLVHNRIPHIQKGLKKSANEIREAIKSDIARLDLHPGTKYSRNRVQPITTDMSIEEEEGQLKVVVNEEELPRLRFNRLYLKMLEDDKTTLEEKEFIRQKLSSAKWLMKNITQRQSTLKRIGIELIKQQREFFQNPQGKLKPLTMKEIADELELHESTIARAVSNKYLNSPRGLMPLRAFFTHAYTDDKGEELSSKTVCDYLKEIIDKEDKQKPLSDEKISAQIQAQGIPCARRTIAKYRDALHIGNAHQRKQY